MEELWKDMSLSSPVTLQSYHLHSPAAVYLKDYLAGPVPPLPPHTLKFTDHGGTGPPSASGDDDPFGFSFASSGINNSNAKRVQVSVPAAAASARDRRQRRMMKNRESAARSRARKQAYTNELELEVAQLRRENQMLIKREQGLITVPIYPDCPQSIVAI
jgi:hypothetical protein